MAYDPLLAKIIVSAPLGDGAGFEAARVASLKALREYKVEGLLTNQSMLARILEHPTFTAAGVFTTFLEENPHLTSSEQPKSGGGAPAQAGEMVEIVSPFEGSVVQLSLKVGDTVVAGDAVVVISAMKLDTDIRCDVDGVVESISVAAADQVSAGQVLVTIKSTGSVQSTAEEEEEAYVSEGVQSGPNMAPVGMWRPGYSKEPADGPNVAHVLRSTVRTGTTDTRSGMLITWSLRSSCTRGRMSLPRAKVANMQRNT
eukprot:TRINITY_DN9689_c0_g1_i1.p2 TRINITY_DN9689_c0_g1~~TRINITY_DN9689_c0_g1_i1.p2  ORF type:complete len:257 (-),score=61.97 TRINITY_DN9689_c0_g1_i1:447-1217(-)